jgi:serine/threonine protein kinase
MSALTLTHERYMWAIGTVWLAPEILENKAYTEKADVYSLGVIFWELLTKERFFGHVKFMSILEDMVQFTHHHHHHTHHSTHSWL